MGLLCGPHRTVAHNVSFSTGQKQLAVLIERLAKNDPGLAQVLVYLCFAHSHCLSDHLCVNDRPSAPLPPPRVRIAGGGKGMLLDRMIGTKRTNALKRRPHRWPKLRKSRYPVQQFPGDDLVLGMIPTMPFRSCQSRQIGGRADAVVLLVSST
jgi:hypothetical protein